MTVDVIEALKNSQEFGDLGPAMAGFLEVIRASQEQNERLFKALVRLYKKKAAYAACIADLCDTTLDRSGALLGRVRDAAYSDEAGG